MDNRIEHAKQMLLQHDYTCVLCSPETEYHSTKRGVRPLLDFLESDVDFRGFVAADKIVGAGAAHIYVLLGVSSVWAKVISESGKRVLERYGVVVNSDMVVPHIINRAGDGICPIEAVVGDVEDADEALVLIKKRLAELSA